MLITTLIRDLTMQQNIPSHLESTEMTHWSGPVEDEEMISDGKPGYVSCTINNVSYHLPSVLEHDQNLILGSILQLDLNDALEMPGSVHEVVHNYGSPLF
jgi:hypothetical protein